MLKIITANYKFEYDWVASCYKLLPFQPVFTKAKTSRHKHRICKIRVRPNARQVVITAGSPSGIAATAKATAILSSNGGDMTHMTLSICKWWEWQWVACRCSMLGKSEFRWTASQSACTNDPWFLPSYSLNWKPGRPKKNWCQYIQDIHFKRCQGSWSSKCIHESP